MAENDARNRDGGSKADRSIMTNVKSTAAGSGVAGGGVIALEYVFACVKAHVLLTPTVDQAIGILIVTSPFLHLVGRIIMYWTSKLLPKDAESQI